MEFIEENLIVGAKVVIGKDYAEYMHHLFDEGQTITLVNGWFECENGLYTTTEDAPSYWDEENKEFESIYHLFGNDLENFMDCQIIPENKYVKAIRELFEKEVETKDNAEWQPSYKEIPYYWKWFGTWKIQEKTGDKSDKVRRELRKLEKEGLIESDNHPHYINWSLKDYHGFKQHEFRDYVQRK